MGEGGVTKELPGPLMVPATTRDTILRTRSSSIMKNVPGTPIWSIPYGVFPKISYGDSIQISYGDSIQHHQSPSLGQIVEVQPISVISVIR